MYKGGIIIKSEKIIKNIDSFGRVYLPAVFRNLLDMPHDKISELAFFIDGETLILTKYDVSCIFCGECRELKVFEGKNICLNCINNLKNII